MENKCEICHTVFEPPRTNKRRRTCSSTCSKLLQKRTMGKGSASEKHGFTRLHQVEKLHGVWRGIIKRCYCKTSSGYVGYGARGIEVCDEWKTDYVAFRSWYLSQSPDGYRTVDRINNNGPYSPDNCKLSTAKEQARNRRSSVFLEYNGEKKLLSDWAEIAGIPYATMYARVRGLGWTMEQAMELKLYTKKPHAELL